VEFPFPVASVSEGAANLLVPDIARRKGPGTAGPWPFYNPTMAVNRDLSAIVLAKWPGPLRSVLDGLAATGAWGIRMALETRADRVTFNDWSPEATRLIRENVRRNGLVARVHQGELRSLLDAGRYDFVDVDPFGPPTPFLAFAFDGVKGSAGIGITATDTAVLCGTYPKACQKRYGGRPLRSPQGAEIGLRILLGYCARIAEERDLWIRPILAFSAEHFLRAIVMVSSGSAPPPLGYVARGESGDIVATTAANRDAVGPLWLGPLGDSAVVRELQPSAWTAVVSARLLSLLKTECEMPPFFVTTDELAAREHRSPPRLDWFIEGLRAIGHRATRTHFHPRGVKTDAPWPELARLFRDLSPTGSTGDSRPAS
jgi:tRNA (guanine26-N2/guanine27-N2)-dimethyltransferase